MGAPAEDWHYTDIRPTFGRIRTFLPQPARSRDGAPGQITDDTTLRHYMCLAIMRKAGRITPDDYAAVWLSDLNPLRLFFTERIVVEKLKLGMSPWETGRGQPPADAAIMAVAPVGIINAGDPDQAYQDAFNVSSIHQDGVERDAAATTAAGFAAAFLPGATPALILDTMLDHGTFHRRRLVAMGRELAAETGDVDLFTERFYLRFLDRSFPRPPGWVWDKDRTVSPTSREVLPIVCGLFELCGGEPEASISAGASFGRDADTIATLLGGLSGALFGASAIPQDWIDASETANVDFFKEVSPENPASFRSTVSGMIEALKAERLKTANRLVQLDRLLAG
jgi:ADP-ribosylglycohydrolase